jgi:hypothetical protein
MYKNLIWLLENPIEDSLDLTFSVHFDLFGVSHDHNLMKDGDKIIVT